MDALIDNDYRKMSTFSGKCKHFQEDVKSFRKNQLKNCQRYLGKIRVRKNGNAELKSRAVNEIKNVLANFS